MAAEDNGNPVNNSNDLMTYLKSIEANLFVSKSSALVQLDKITIQHPDRFWGPLLTESCMLYSSILFHLCFITFFN